MSDSANPLKVYHQRQIEDQAQPVRLYGPDGGTPQVQLSGSSAGDESDQTGTGNDTVEFDTATQYVDVYNGGSTNLSVTTGGVTRYVPPGPRLCAFPEAATTFTIVADGAWVVTRNE